MIIMKLTNGVKVIIEEPKRDSFLFRKVATIEHGNKRWRVSTAGKYLDIFSGEIKEMSEGFYYETLAFDEEGEEISLGNNTINFFDEETSDQQAEEMHWRIINQLSKEIKEN